MVGRVAIYIKACSFQTQDTVSKHETNQQCRTHRNLPRIELSSMLQDHPLLRPRMIWNDKEMQTMTVTRLYKPNVYAVHGPCGPSLFNRLQIIIDP
jgi:hypothetical protein